MVVSGACAAAELRAGRPYWTCPGRGRIVAFNFSPIHRDMNRSDHRLLWNAILNWNALVR
jgi:hypothetical protein